MIDLSTLIALLTALASSTVSSPPTGPFEPRASEPPGHHCSSADPRGSGSAERRLEIPNPRARSVLPPIDDDRSAPSTSEPDREATRQLRDDSDDDTKDDDTKDDDTKDDDTKDDDTKDDDTKGATKDNDGDDEKPETTTDTRSPRSKSSDRDNADRSASRESSSEKSSTDDGEKSGSTDRSTPPRLPTLPRPEVTRAAPPDDDGADGARHPDPTCTDRGSDRRSKPRTESNPGSTDRSEDPASANVEAPSDLVDLDNWYLTLPTGPKGDPDTIQPAELVGYSSSYFQLNKSGNGVVFTAPVDGATTKNSDYPRSELREMNGTEKAAWSNGNGTHTLRATEAVTELPESKPELVTAQIHGGDDDILQIRLEGNHLMIQYADGAKQVTLDPDYRLGTPYDIEIRAAANSVQVGYNGEQKAELPLAGSTWYFKAGAYVQSNPSKGDEATAAGQVIIYSLEVTHS